MPLPLIMITCTTLRHALLEWQMNNSVHPKASKSKVKAGRPDRSNCLNYKNHGVKNTSCCAATGHKLLTSPGIADTYTVLMNTWNTLPENYQHRVYKNTLATVKHQIQQGENPTAAMVISVDAAPVDNAIRLDYLTYAVALQVPEIGSTDPNIPPDKTCMTDQMCFRMPRGSGDYEDEGHESNERNAISTASRQRCAVTELMRFELGTTDADGYEGKNGNDADADEEEEASQADDESTRNVEDWRYSTTECEDWTVYFRPIKSNNGEANAMATNVSEAKTELLYVTTSQSETYMGRVWHPRYSNSGEVKCGTRPENGVNCARHCVNSCSITTAPAKSITHRLFGWCIYITTFCMQRKRGTYAMGSL